MSDDEAELAQLRRHKFGRNVSRKESKNSKATIESGAFQLIVDGSNVPFIVKDIHDKSNEKESSSRNNANDDIEEIINHTNNRTKSRNQSSINTFPKTKTSKFSAEWLDNVNIESLPTDMRPATIKEENDDENPIEIEVCDSDSADSNPNPKTKNKTKNKDKHKNKNKKKSKRKQSNSNSDSNSNSNNGKKKQHTFNKKTRHEARAIYEKLLSRYTLPLSFEAELEHHSSIVSCCALDRSGTRLLTGSYDCSIFMYDFGGMKDDFKPFRSITPKEGYPIESIDFSNDGGSLFLAITSSNQPLIFNREGKEEIKLSKGDMYIRDLNRTHGHIMPCLGGKWMKGKSNLNELITWSQDGTVRLWDISSDKDFKTSTELNCKQIWKAFNNNRQSLKRLHITACDVSNDNRYLLFGCNDGSLQSFDLKTQVYSKNTKPNKLIDNAHNNGSNISDIVFHPCDNNIVVSRGGYNDNRMKIWDLRMIGKRKHINSGNNKGKVDENVALKVFGNLYNIHSKTNVLFAPPNNKLLITATSPKNAEFIDESISFGDASKIASNKLKTGTSQKLKIRDFTKKEYQGNAPIQTVENLHEIRFSRNIEKKTNTKAENDVFSNVPDDTDLDRLMNNNNNNSNSNNSGSKPIINKNHNNNSGKIDMAKKSSLVLFSTENKDFREVLRIPICEKAINQILYHSKIKHIILACSDTKTRIYYDDKISINGALLCKERKAKKQHIDEEIKYLHIQNPNSLREFRESRIEYLKNKEKKKERLKTRPILPHYGTGIGGRINSENFSAYTLRSIEKNVLHDVDPQRALQSWDKKAKEDMYWTKIYQINQPQTLFSEAPDANRNENGYGFGGVGIMNEDGHIQNVGTVIESRRDVEKLMKLTKATTNTSVSSLSNANDNNAGDQVPPKKKRKLNF